MQMNKKTKNLIVSFIVAIITYFFRNRAERKDGE